MEYYFLFTSKIKPIGALLSTIKSSFTLINCVYCWMCVFHLSKNNFGMVRLLKLVSTDGDDDDELFLWYG